MSDILVTSPFQPFTLPTQFKAVFNGYIYCGTVDAVDPSVSQVQVYLVNEAGDKVPVAQPLRTNAGGYLVYNGQPAMFVTSSSHSILVKDSMQSQVWYHPNMSVMSSGVVQFGSRVDMVASIPLDLVGDGELVVAGGFVYKKVTGSTAISDLPGFEPHGDANPEHWGAPGDGVTNEAPFFQQALNWLAQDPSRKMKEIRNVTRMFTSGLTTDGHVNWDMGSAKYIIDYDGLWLDACGNRNPVFYALPSDYVIGSVNVPVATLPSAPKRGDWIRIISNAVNPNDRTRIGQTTKYRIQEYALVGAGSTTTNIVLEKPLSYFEGVDYAETGIVNAYGPTWNARVVLVDTSKVFEMSGGNISYPTGKTYGPGAISCRAYYKPKLIGQEFRHVYGSGIYLDGTLFAEVDRVSGYDFADNEAGVQNGYVITDGGYYSRVVHSEFGKCRHGYTTLRVSLADNTTFAFGGGNTVGGRVVECTAIGSGSGQFNTHHGAVDIRFINCNAEGPSDSAFGGRGLDCWVIGCSSIGSKSGLKWLMENDGLAGMLEKYAPSVTIVDSDLHGTFQVFNSDWSRVIARDSIFRSNTLRQLVAGSASVTIQGVVKFVTDTVNGMYPIVPPTSSAPVSTSIIDVSRPWLAGRNRITIDSGSMLEFDLRAFTSLPGDMLIIGANTEFHLLGKLRALLPDGANIMSLSAARVISLPTSEIEIQDSNAATITFGTMTNKAIAYTSLGTPLISGIEFQGPAGDGFIIKEPTGTMIAYGDKSLGSRIVSGTGTFADPYTTNGVAITFGATFVGAPVVTFQYKAIAGATVDLRRGVVEYDSVSSTAIGGVRGRSLSSSVTDTTITAAYHAIGRWK